MITTSDIINITKTLRLGVTTTYTVNDVSLFVRHSGEEKRFTASSVVNASPTSTGLITFSNISLWGDGSYSMKVTAEDNTDLDVSGVKLVSLGTGYVKKITNTDTIDI